MVGGERTGHQGPKGHPCGKSEDLVRLMGNSWLLPKNVML